MQISKINVDRLYQTTKGVGTCLAVTKTSIRFRLDVDSSVVWLHAKEVQYELPDQPVAVDDAEPAEPDQPAARPGRRKTSEQRLLAIEMMTVCISAQAHIVELAEAFRTGALRSTDGNNEFRANRNNEVRLALERILDKVKGIQ